MAYLIETINNSYICKWNKEYLPNIGDHILIHFHNGNSVAQCKEYKVEACVHDSSVYIFISPVSNNAINYKDRIKNIRW